MITTVSLHKPMFCNMRMSKSVVCSCCSWGSIYQWYNCFTMCFIRWCFCAMRFCRLFCMRICLINTLL